MTRTDLPENRTWLWDLEEHDLFRVLVVCEAGNEPIPGMMAVVNVVQNRTQRSIEAVIPWFARTNRGNILMKHQFSCFWFDWRVMEARCKAASKLTDSASLQLKKAERAVKEALAGVQGDRSLGADHYLNPDTVLKLSGKLPVWAREEQITCRIGRHVFYNSLA